MGLVRPCGCGPGETGLGRSHVICRLVYSQVVGLGVRGKRCEVRTFGGVGEVLAEDLGPAVKTGPGGAVTGTTLQSAGESLEQSERSQFRLGDVG